jgi:integral membrane protein
MTNPHFLRFFRWITILEGWSYLLLLLVAMPLKYYFDSPQYVRVVGMAHGLLFTVYMIQLVYGKMQYKWSIRNCVLLGFASVLPLATFYADRKLLRYPERLTIR